MPSKDMFDALEKRVEALELAMLELNTLVKILKPVALLLGASVGMDVTALL